MLQLKELVRPQLRPGTTKTNKIKLKKTKTKPKKTVEKKERASVLL